LNRAHETKRPFNELLQYYSMERFLYRLSKSPHADKFILKGALMFVAWKAPLTRPTMDIDFLGKLKNDPEAIARVMSDVCRETVPDDGATFDPSRVTTRRINEDADYQGVRGKIRGRLGNARLAIQVDVGFGDAVVPRAATVNYPTLLPFPAPKLRGYTRESALAEKFEAMTKLGMLNSRLKDFYDVWLLARQFDFEGTILAKAVRRTFETRKTTLDPKLVALTKKFADSPDKKVQWRAFVRRNQLTDVPGELNEVVEFNSGFLLPVAAALVEGREFAARWSAPGPWSPR
jgi:hypothetical protein